MTQSAFSRRIKQLELWLGVTLVNRATFPAELTREGRTFLPVAQDTVRQFYNTRKALQPSREVKKPRPDIFSLAHADSHILSALAEADR